MLLLRLHNPGAGRSFEHTAERTPVIIGRDPSQAGCAIENDLDVSREHASVELRGDEIYARDLGSTNGTFFNGVRLGDQWTSLGHADTERQITLAAWVIGVRRAARPAVVKAEASLASTERAPEVPRATAIIRPTLRSGEPLGPEYETMRLANANDLPRPVIVAKRLAKGIEEHRSAERALYEEIESQIEALPASERAAACEELAIDYPDLARGVLRALFERCAVTVPPESPPPLPPDAAAALTGVQGLSHWWTKRTVLSAADIKAFCTKVRGVHDEFVQAHLEQVKGIERFEKAVAVGAGENAFRLPQTRAEFSHALLDWNDSTDRALEALRRELTDLKLHHLGMFDGVMAGVKALLDEFDPDAIEEAWNERQARRDAVTRKMSQLAKDKELMEIYFSRHRDLADEENTRFRKLFGPEFAEAYKAHAIERRSRSTSSGLDRPAADPPQLAPGPRTSRSSE
ncbi:FHA domain-containing protein [Pendulispora brunnea]|uniref:FHA domain-containing protein n=1 Tax=Pendulispora brunnea TaxID=2905690 RepID=A0ABZ2KKD7_9BACT